MSRRASETPSSVFLKASDFPQLPQQPRYSRGVQPIVIHGKSNSSVNVSSLPESKSSRSLFKNLKRLTHRSKLSTSNSSNIEISLPLLVHHKTAEELISSLESSSPPEVLPFIRSERLSKIKILHSTELSETNHSDNNSEKQSNTEIPIISITSTNSSNSEISPKTSLDVSPKISKTIPAQNAAKIILNALPPPPPVPELPRPPSKNPRRLTTAEEKDSTVKLYAQTKRSNRSLAIDKSDFSSVQNKTLFKPPGGSHAKHSFLNPEVDDIPLHQIPCQFSDSELSSPLSDSVRSEITDDQTTPTVSPLTTPSIPPKASCRINGLPPLSPKRVNKAPTKFNDLYQDGLAFPSSDKLDSPIANSLSNPSKKSLDRSLDDSSLIQALQNQNALLSQELDYTKRLLAKEVQQRVRAKSSSPKPNLKLDPIFSRAF